ncbi:16S rRNA (guanine(966)-N(2))-methyltransferase RsmD [Oceanospirillum maris]|uniref:16S rRNA (guanine(966)-N(2))-methyltransferase RsmD n=1 Tax=Oceanospirillum maris TaxID=64977 RepID=UPI0003FA149C|nr:16S rRNA (guanine(966)-N(2))-methyltransferase RsmD [Oceanospirillum maris]
MPKSRRSAARHASVGRSVSSSSVTGKKTASGKNQLRIVGGEWRGRKLPFPDGEGLRPTGDRMRETLFNWLNFELFGRRVLDLFAGSGALGLEALSRGAKSAVFLDNHSGVIRQIRENLTTLKCENADVAQGDALSWIASQHDAFDLIFLDPPFGKGLLAPVCQALDAQGVINDRALIYLEAEKHFDFSDIPLDWQLKKEKRAGQVICRLYQRIAVETHDD